MADKKLAVIFTSDTSAARKGVADLNKALGSTEDQVKKTGGTFKSALGGVALAAGIGFATSEFEEAEATARKTEAVIRSTGNAAQVTAAQQDQMVQSLSQLAAVDDEVVAGGANVLRTFKSIQGQQTFEGALGAAMNLSAALGTDLQSAAMQVGKALENPEKGIAALARAGVSFSAVQKQQIRDFVEVGDKASAQKMILAELETQFGGQAEAAATSSARMKVAFGNASEAVGSVLAPAMTVGAGAAAKLATVLDTLPASAKTVGVVAVGGALAWGRWGDAFASWGSRAAGAASKAVDLARTLNSGLDGVAATRGISKTQAGVEALKASLTTSVADFGKFKSAAVAAAAGLASFGATTAVLESMARFHGDLGGLATDLDQLGRGVAGVDVITAQFGGSIDSLAGSFKIAYDNSSLAERGFNVVKSALTADGGEGFKAVRQAQSDIEALDSSLASLVASGNIDGARAAHGQLTAALTAQGVATEDIARFMPQYHTALERAERETSEAATATDGMTKAQGRAEAQARRTASAFAEMGPAAATGLRALGDGFDFAEMAAAAYMDRALDVFSAQQAYSESTRALTDHQREAAEVQAQNAETTKRNSEALRQHAQAVQQAAEQVRSAAASQADAQDALSEAYANARPDAEAMVEAERRVAEARAGTAAAAEVSRLAQEGLNQAYKDGAQYLKDLEEAASDNATSVEAAQLAYDKALAAQAELAKTGSDDPFAAREMALRVKQALDALEDAHKRAAESSATLNAANKAGVENTPQVVAARDAITAAAEGEVDANARLDAAVKAQAATQAAAAEQIAAAQAQLGTATAALNTAQANLATTQSTGVELTKTEAIHQQDLGGKILANATAKLALAKAEAEANGKTLTAAESAAILKAGMDEGRTATGFWSDDLNILSGELDKAAKERKVELDTAAAMEKAKLFGQRVETLPDGTVVIKADTSQADGALDALGSKISALGSTLTGNLSSIISQVAPGYAKGGPVKGGQLALVGEEGPELVVFGANGWVNDAAKTKQFLAGSSGAAGLAMAAGHGVAAGQTQVVIHVAGSVLTERDLTAVVADGMNRASRNQPRPLLR